MFDLTKSYCNFFNEICKIPHGSGNERALSDWLVRFANERGLAVLQDGLWNVIIYKPAAAGYENHPGVIIQAHMDMVCEKVPESTHNFETDPLELYTEGDHLRARGTTLGADDGMGCAYMLAILDAKELPHPYLECCFTTQEEVGLVGAQALKPEYFKARRLINLDGAGEYRTYTTLAGSRSMVLRRNAQWQAADAPAYTLKISGLLGGRTGDDIDKERANAGKLAASYLLRLMQSGVDVRLVELTTKAKSGIPDEGAAVFISEAEESALLTALEETKKVTADEYALSDPDIRMELTPATAERAACAADSAEWVKLLYLLPSGPLARFVDLNLPSYSANLGTLSRAGDCFEARYAGRSPFEPRMDELETAVRLLCEKFGAEAQDGKTYYGYRCEPDSPLRDVMDRVFLAQYGKPLLHVAAHGGNECGVFKHMFDDMDIVTSGAIYAKHHTPEEYLDLASFDRTFEFLAAFLAAL